MTATNQPSTNALVLLFDRSPDDLELNHSVALWHCACKAWGQNKYLEPNGHSVREALTPPAAVTKAMPGVGCTSKPLAGPNWEAKLWARRCLTCM